MNDVRISRAARGDLPELLALLAEAKDVVVPHGEERQV